jgi:hypothetical protein
MEKALDKKGVCLHNYYRQYSSPTPSFLRVVLVLDKTNGTFRIGGDPLAGKAVLSLKGD